MIRINLLSVSERQASRKRGGGVGVALQLAGQKLTIACSLILVLAVVGIGWRFWTINRESTQLDEEISAEQQETTRLHSVIQQVQQFEQRRAQLQQRVVLIEQLRKGQTGPVHMLDQVSRALPPMLWLTELKQNEKTPGEVLIEGRATTLTSLSDFVSNLEATGYFKKSVEIVSTTAEPMPQPPGELIKFSIRAQFQTPTDAKPAAGARTGGN